MDAAQIKRALSEAGLRPNAALGQNFCVDEARLAAIADAADVAGRPVLEVGPGLGALTEPLLARAARVVAVEKDAALAVLLSRRLAAAGARLAVYPADILRFDVAAAMEAAPAAPGGSAPGNPAAPGAPGGSAPGNPAAPGGSAPGNPGAPGAPGGSAPGNPAAPGSFHSPGAPGGSHSPAAPGAPGGSAPGNPAAPGAPGGSAPGNPAAPGSFHSPGAPGAAFCVAGNLPYYITTPIVERLLPLLPLSLTLMVQREAAARFSAGPGARVYGPVAVFSQLYYTVRHVMDVPRDSYYPQPEVDSSVVHLARRDALPDAEPAALLAFLHRAFAMRRKTLWNNLARAPQAAAALAALGLPADVRAEALPPAALLAVFQALPPGP